MMHVQKFCPDFFLSLKTINQGFAITGQGELKSLNYLL